MADDSYALWLEVLTSNARASSVVDVPYDSAAVFPSALLPVYAATTNIDELPPPVTNVLVVLDWFELTVV